MGGKEGDSDWELRVGVGLGIGTWEWELGVGVGSSDWDLELESACDGWARGKGFQDGKTPPARIRLVQPLRGRNLGGA